MDSDTNNIEDSKYKDPKFQEFVRKVLKRTIEKEKANGNAH